MADPFAPTPFKVAMGDLPLPEITGPRLDTRLLPDTVLRDAGILPDTRAVAPVQPLTPILSSSPGDRFTLQAEIATIDGAVQAQQEVINNGSQLLPVGAIQPANPDPDQQFQEGLIRLIQAGALVAIVDADGNIVLVPPGQVTPAPPPAPAQTGGSDSGASDTSADSAPGSNDVITLPPGGCETNTVVTFDQNGNVSNIENTHFDGAIWESV